MTSRTVSDTNITTQFCKTAVDNQHTRFRWTTTWETTLVSVPFM